jgi:hypothetical protein
MKIVLEQVGGHLEMFVEYSAVDDHLDLDSTVVDMTAELEHRRGVKRMSYDTWHWDLRRQREAEEYITYFYLKHGY